ncbi:hypothetical protein SK128_004096 [Halocaridina rubra]|uniref:EGF-like domain-containing protein n=1 Tax=Halocaridina rubra TaxID=373956 RepID=A0AAN9FUJ5_HALRR
MKCEHDGLFSLVELKENERLDDTALSNSLNFQCQKGEWRGILPAENITLGVESFECAYKCQPPCLNGGVCMAFPDGEKECLCHHEYTGPQCQTKKCYVGAQSRYDKLMWLAQLEMLSQCLTMSGIDK